jgi:hypothetical protein
LTSLTELAAILDGEARHDSPHEAPSTRAAFRIATLAFLKRACSELDGAALNQMGRPPIFALLLQRTSGLKLALYGASFLGF